MDRFYRIEIAGKVWSLTGGKDMKLKKLLESSMRKIEVVEYYNDAMTFLYDFSVEEIPEDVQDKIKKFDIVEKNGKVVLMVVEK